MAPTYDAHGNLVPDQDFSASDVLSSLDTGVQPPAATQASAAVQPFSDPNAQAQPFADDATAFAQRMAAASVGTQESQQTYSFHESAQQRAYDQAYAQVQAQFDPQYQQAYQQAYGQQGYYQQATYSQQPSGYAQGRLGQKSKVVAGLLGIFLGAFGVHKFYLGYTTQGLILLLATFLTFGMAGAITSIIGLIEGIIYLTKSDYDFYALYEYNQKPWF